jgi:DHA1 family bicyclomycin/chloramphenicol resistance-like MFS transporter
VSDPNRRQLVVGVFLVAAGLARWCRVPWPIAMGGARCCWSRSFYVRSPGLRDGARFRQPADPARAARGVQRGVAVLPAAIVRDRFAGDRMARTLSTVSTVFMVVPMLAPSVGQFVLLFAGWRWIFGVLATLGAVMGGWIFLRLPETLDPANRQPILPLTIARNMAHSGWSARLRLCWARRSCSGRCSAISTARSNWLRNTLARAAISR